MTPKAATMTKLFPTGPLGVAARRRSVARSGACVLLIAGLLGGLTVGAYGLDIPPQQYIARMEDTMELRHFLVGLSKAPVFALVISLIGCLEGLRVEGTAQSVGERTTSSVVQAISLVIIIDAFAAIWFMQMGV